MDDTPFSVDVLVDGHVLERLSDDHGFFVRGRPGTLYSIVLGFDGPGGSTVVAKVFVDGHPVFLEPRFARSLNPGKLRVKGWDVARIVEDIDADWFQEAYDIAPFRFRFPVVTGGPADPNLGTIRVELYEALAQERMNMRGGPPSLVRPAAVQPRQGKKAHMAERLTTEAGEKERTAFAVRSKSGRHTVFDAGSLLHTICLRYFQDHSGGGSSSGSHGGGRPRGLHEAGGAPPALPFPGPGVRLGGRPREDRGPRAATAADSGAAARAPGSGAPNGAEEMDADIATAVENSLASSHQEEARLIDDALRQSLQAQEEEERWLAEAVRRSLQPLEADGEMDHAAAQRAASSTGPTMGADAAGPTTGPAAAARAPSPAAAAAAAGAAAAAAEVRPGAAASEAGAAGPWPAAGSTASEAELGASQRPGGPLGVLYDYRVGEEGHLRALYRLPGHLAAAGAAPKPQPPVAPDRPWQKYRDGEGAMWWYKDDNEWFREDSPGEWQRFRLTVGSRGGYWWYKDDSNWFLEDDAGRCADEQGHQEAAQSLPGQVAAAGGSPEAAWQKYRDDAGIWWYRSGRRARIGSARTTLGNGSASPFLEILAEVAFGDGIRTGTGSCATRAPSIRFRGAAILRAAQILQQ
ncbi:unnamed protein product [Prorocentrum cordatum]|uniref:Galectin n=1 Tax=Prorocentrum cordatum TaxID=2364126 RepID=A0ABN9VX66_9DINO|nr:unnamed protein product [Polarella glacialis]